MSNQHHYLKTETEFYQAVEAGVKTFELRKNDRDFQVGDIVTLMEVVKAEFTGRELPAKEIKYILHGGQFGLPEGYCILQLEDIHQWGHTIGYIAGPTRAGRNEPIPPYPYK